MVGDLVGGVEGQVATSLGIAAGLDKGLKEYFSTHYTIGSDVNFPIYPGYFVSAGAYGWATSEFEDSGDFLPSDIGGAYGMKFPVGAEAKASLGAIIDGLLGGASVQGVGSLQSGQREPFKWATDIVYGALKETDGWSVAGVGLGLNPKLVTADGNSCPENWSEKEDTLCRIKIGNEDDSAAKRAAKLGLAMNTVTGSFSNPVTVQAIAVATLVGAMKDAGVSVPNYCNFDAQQQTVDSR